ncbi:alpha/beta fold hydrolase [Nocardia sp. NBC_01503]|uniref:alpha/beta fold hydrolase n=1 Tax=Nocardia sp. NBC_01503 TaxID=2975997 RepID=UPI002E7BC8B7|nr:alpha/beta fold hydrolase [Nocardia sp. NBC_01503]WTL30185.1 alpha/beta fold hydrolase [Nocardia sp. NBC_01503]
MTGQLEHPGTPQQSTPARTPAPERGYTVRNGDIEIAVFEYGDRDAEPLVLVHGWPDTHHLWDGVIPLLADRFRVIAYDTRGYGQSTVPDTVAAFRLEELAKDFFAVIDAVSPGRPVQVIAHDWGSVQVWEAICEPGAEERVRSFTSISGPNLDHLATWMRAGLSRPTPRNAWGPITQMISSAYTGFFMIPLLPALFFRLFGGARSWRLFLRVVEGIPAERVHLAPTLRRDMVSGLRFYRANILARLSSPRERRTKVPVQLLVNSRDIAVRPAGFDRTGEWVETLVRRDLSHGHWLPFANPEVIARAGTEFIYACAIS